MEEVEYTLEEYVSMYYDEIKDEIPNMIKYVDLIFDEIGYYMQIYDNNEKNLTYSEYNNTLDDYEVISLCNKILGTLSDKYVSMFNKYLKDGIIQFKNGEEEITCMSDKYIIIAKTNTIEEVLCIIHELFHRIHIEMYNNNLQDPEWFFSSEMIAMLFEFYAAFYMNRNNMYVDDIKVYFNKIFISIYEKAINVVHEALILDVYDKFKSIDSASLCEFINLKNMDEEVLDLLSLFNEQEDEIFTYHIEATYLFGFPISIMSGLLMAYNPEYLSKVVYSFNSINNGSIEDFMHNINMDNILHDCDGEQLYQVAENINQFIDIIHEEKITGKELILGG